MNPQLRLVHSRTSRPEVSVTADCAISPSCPRVIVPAKESRRVLTPKTLFRGLARELELLAPAYLKLRADHEALSPYPTLASLMDRLTLGPRDDAKKGLLASLVGIRQSSPHRLWVAILLRAFRPMLAKLWKELFGSDTQERLALLILAFQGAIQRVDPLRDPIRIAMYVRQKTRRRAFAALSKELSWSDVGFGVAADECADTRGEEVPERRRPLEPLLRGSALQAHIRRAHPTLSSDEQTLEYQRLRRRLRRALLAAGRDRDDKEVTR